MSNVQSDVKILTDDVDIRPILDFERYSETIVKMVKGTDPKFLFGYMENGEQEKIY